MDDSIPTIPTQRAAEFETADDEVFGACLCPEFSYGRRLLHSAGQPGCAYEVRAS
ncbi:hypothetical protein [Actinokineospora bangkokensis]|uniref:hypothetical protein n=1 Tax=Actinokineospora bangkokensis TaxID=1193682 RepID=UPI000AB9766B|nr:hypothetical protein [Actinokineospora bangkokensis]